MCVCVSCLCAWVGKEKESVVAALPCGCVPLQVIDPCGMLPPQVLDVAALVPLPALTTRACGRGWGMAACVSLGVLVTSCTEDNTLSVFTLPAAPPGPSHHGTGLAHICVLGGPSSPPAMRFNFEDEGCSVEGGLAFTDPTADSPPLLLVADTFNGAVHVIDVVTQQHVGHVNTPRSIDSPRGVATKGTLVAISAWSNLEYARYMIHVFRGSGASWELEACIRGGWGEVGPVYMSWPNGLRFTADGTGLVVCAKVEEVPADESEAIAMDEGCGPRAVVVSLFRVPTDDADSSGYTFVRHINPREEPKDPSWGACDVEECGEGWLVARHDLGTVEVVVDGHVQSRVRTVRQGAGGPSALVLVPGLGLVVREESHGLSRVRVFASPDDIAMGAMSQHRVAWLVGVARGVLHRGLPASAPPVHGRRRLTL